MRHPLVIRAFNHIDPIIGENTYVDPQSTVIGNVVLGADCSVWPQTVIRGDMHSIRIGDRCSIQDGSVIHVTHSAPETSGGAATHIGSNVTVGHKVLIHGATIEDYCLIGMGAMIIDNAIIETEVILGAGSLVPKGKVLQSGFLYFGRPAKQIRALTDEEKSYLRYTAEKYVQLKSQYMVEND